MKKASKAFPRASDDLRSEYSFDYSKAKANPYAAQLKGHTVAVVLEPDVAAAFPNSKAVNRQLRAVVAAVPRRSAKTRRSPKARRSNKGEAYEARLTSELRSLSPVFGAGN